MFSLLRALPTSLTRPMHRAALRSVALAAGLLAASSAAHAAPSPSGQDVMHKAEEARRLGDVTASATLTTSGEGGDTKAKSFTWWRKLGADRVHFRTLTRFSAPAEIRGEGILIEERPSGENDVQLYLPRFHKVRRVEAQSQSSSFMGSTFSYSDIADPKADDYKHDLVRSEACPGGGGQCFVIQSTPASDAVKDRTGYGRTVQWVRTDNFMTVSGEFYDAQGALWKKLTATNIREVDPSTHKWMALSVRMEDVKAKRTTVLVLDQPKVNTNVPDSTFTVQNLSRE